MGGNYNFNYGHIDFSECRGKRFLLQQNASRNIFSAIQIVVTIFNSATKIKVTQGILQKTFVLSFSFLCDRTEPIKLNKCVTHAL